MRENSPSKDGSVWAPYWPTIGSLVEQIVEAAGDVRANRSDLYDAVTPLVGWAWQTHGLPMRADKVITVKLIERFVHTVLADLTPATRATWRSTLYRVMEQVNPVEAPAKRRTIPKSDRSQPYTREEVAALHAWGISHQAASRRFNATILLVLGLGAGLATQDLLPVCSDHVTVEEDHSLITVSGVRPRIVPVLPEWHHVLHDLRHDKSWPEDGRWLFCRNRSGCDTKQVSDFVHRIRAGLDIRPARMRATWLQTHLRLGTPPVELLRISGLRNFAALDDIDLDPDLTGATE